jgi:hypothetical protein
VEAHDEDTAARIAHEHMGRALAVRIQMLGPDRVRRLPRSRDEDEGMTARRLTDEPTS